MGNLNAQQRNDPGQSCFAVTPSDADGIPVTRALRTNVSGIATVLFVNDTAAVPLYMLAGVDYGWQIKQVKATGTDADMEIYGLR